MSLVAMKEILEDAQKRQIGIGMFNVVTMDFAQAIIEAADKAETPVILGMPGRFFEYYPIDLMPKICVHFARKATVPVAVHLDHGKNFDIVMQALRAGFTSVMYDGSAHVFRHYKLLKIIWMKEELMKNQLKRCIKSDFLKQKLYNCS